MVKIYGHVVEQLMPLLTAGVPRGSIPGAFMEDCKMILASSQPKDGEIPLKQQFELLCLLLQCAVISDTRY